MLKSGYSIRGEIIMVVTLANKIRLWFAAGCTAIGLVLLISIPTSDGTHYIYSSGNGELTEGWALIFLAAAVTLASITLYKFVKSGPAAS
jgi:hypothetical protein